MPSLLPVIQRRPWLTWLSCLACIVVFLGIHSDREGSDQALQHWGYADAGDIYSGAYWSLFSTVFVHVEIWHLVFNVYWLFQLGGRMEKALGWWRWLIFVAAASLVSSSAELALTGSTGIGASGVAYAFFGFMWLTRRRVPEFAKILDPRTVIIFLVWLVACMVLTATHVFAVGNAAHLTGLLFGTLAATWILHRPQRRRITAAAVLLIAVSSVTLFWAPWSFTWTAWKGTRAYQRENFAEAIRWYEQSLQQGQDKTWCLHSIALARGCMKDQAAYQQALQALRAVDEKAAQEVEKALQHR